MSAAPDLRAQYERVDLVQNTLHRLNLLSRRTHTPIGAIVGAWDAGMRVAHIRTSPCERSPFETAPGGEATVRLPDVDAMRAALAQLGVTGAEVAPTGGQTC